MTDARLREAFARRLEFYRRSRGAKLARAPLRMLTTASKIAWCRTVGRQVAARARTFWGARMNIMLPQPASLCLLHYGFIEAELTSVVLNLLRPGMNFFDVGAHYGYFSLLAAELVAPGGQVHAFEPSPHAFDVLRRNTEDGENIRIHNVALHAQPGELVLRDFGIEFSEYNTLGRGRLDEQTRRRRNIQPRQITVRADTLDHYVQETGAAPDFIKIDAEGAEMDIFRGMDGVLREVRPMITIEVAPDTPDAPGDSAANVKYLQEHGYTAHEWAGGQLRPHERRDSYTFDNLLFVHPEGRKFE